jgi:hypothetical protein
MANNDAIQDATILPTPADIELAATHVDAKQTDQDPFLVAFSEPYDAENPKDW